MKSNTELFFKIIATTGTFLLAYHKYILSLFDKKTGQERLWKRKTVCREIQNRKYKNTNWWNKKNRRENDKNRKRIDETIQELIHWVKYPLIL